MELVNSATRALTRKGLADSSKPTADGSFLRVSSIGNCIRQQIYDGLRAPVEAGNPDTAANGLVAREIGNTLHSQVQCAMETDPVFEKFRSEVRVSFPEVMRSGHADGVYLWFHNKFGKFQGRICVVEIKTMRNFAFRKARKEGPREQHLLQAATYALGLNVHAVHMVYICTDATPGKWKDQAKAGDTIEWVYELDDRVEESGATLRTITEYVLEMEMRETITALQTGVVPLGLKGSGGSGDTPWECGYCSYRKLCESPEGDSISSILRIKEKDNESVS